MGAFLPEDRRDGLADVHKFSDRLIDLAERSSAVADAAQGRGVRRRSMPVRWLLLPAAGAGVYALMTNRAFTRQAKGVLNQAKERASDLPEDLVDRVQQTTGSGSNSSRSSATRKSTTRRTQRRKTSAR
jgi:hypothetical protein